MNNHISDPIRGILIGFVGFTPEPKPVASCRCGALTTELCRGCTRPTCKGCLEGDYCPSCAKISDNAKWDEREEGGEDGDE